MAENNQPSQNALPSVVYGLFAGAIDQSAVQRFHNALVICSQGGVKEVHLLFHSNGGLIGDGVSLYNLFRASPVQVVLYNVGTVSSVAVVAYLGAKRRIVSKFGAFMIHRAYLTPGAATSERMASGADQLLMEDARMNAIIKEHSNMPAKKWEQHKYSDVWLSADESVEYGLAEFGEFAPPVGASLFNVWPPQN